MGLGRQNIADEGRFINRVEAFTLEDGSRVIRKTPRTESRKERRSPREYDAEELSAKVARVVGLRMPELHRADASTLYVDFVEDAELADVRRPVRSYGDEHFIDLAKTPDGLRLGLLDLLVFNIDRHDSNWFITKEDQIIPIDHGASFQSGDAAPGYARWASSPRNRFERNFVYNPWDEGIEVDEEDGDDRPGDGGRWVPSSPVSRASMRRIRSELEALKADFKTMGHEDWHQAMMERLTEMEKRSNGRIDL